MKEIRHGLLRGKLIQWTIATPVHLPAPLAAGDAGRGVIEASGWVRDGHEWYAGIGVAKLKRQVACTVPQGFLEAAEVRGREREWVVSFGSDVVANDHWEGSPFIGGGAGEIVPTDHGSKT
jgi:hypothetical protein